jgi:hypothetical protein
MHLCTGLNGDKSYLKVIRLQLFHV